MILCLCHSQVSQLLSSWACTASLLIFSKQQYIHQNLRTIYIARQAKGSFAMSGQPLHMNSYICAATAFCNLSRDKALEVNQWSQQPQPFPWHNIHAAQLMTSLIADLILKNSICQYKCDLIKKNTHTHHSASISKMYKHLPTKKRKSVLLKTQNFSVMTVWYNDSMLCLKFLPDQARSSGNSGASVSQGHWLDELQADSESSWYTLSYVAYWEEIRCGCLFTHQHFLYSGTASLFQHGIYVANFISAFPVISPTETASQ